MANIDLCNNCPAFQPKLECVSIPKIFDQCRLQVCLTPNEIGAAKVDYSPINCNINKNTCPNQNHKIISKFLLTAYEKRDRMYPEVSNC